RSFIRESCGLELRRGDAKTINFGLIYGMGVAKLARSLGLSRQEADEMFMNYHLAVPYAKETMSQCSDEASLLGFITTVMGRRSRFDLWEPSQWSENKYPPLPLHKAQQVYGFGIRRAMTHKALNRRLQGGAA